MENTVVVIIILLVFCVAVFCIPVFINRSINTRIINNCREFRDINDMRFNTGDILLYRWNYTLGDFDANSSFFFGKEINPTNIFISLIDSYIYDMPFIHIGVIVIHNNKPCVLELNVSDVYCEYEKKTHVYNPALVSLDHIYDYYGIVGHFPYRGTPVQKRKIDSILSEKNKYIHARHSVGTMAANIRYYITNGDLHCDDINVGSDSECPRYINCLQYIVIVLKKMGIFDGDKNYLTTTTRNIYDECIGENKYGEFTIIRNNYLLDHY